MEQMFEDDENDQNEAMETSVGVDSLQNDSNSDSLILAKCRTKNGFATCRKLSNSWIIEVFLDGKKTASYSLSAAVDKHFEHNQSGSVQYELDPFSEDTSFAHQANPVISCVLSSSHESHSSHETNAVREDVFSSIFGGMAALVDSDVIIVGLPDGRVLWWPFKQTPSSNHELHLLCHLDQPVVGILLGCVNTPTKDNPGDCLIFVGQYGKVIIVSAGKQLHPVFSIEFVSGPVISCCTFKNCLYHTVAGGELWQTQLIRGENHDDISLQGRTLPVLRSRSVSVETIDELGDQKVLRYLTKDDELRSLDFSAIDEVCAKRDSVGSHHEQQITTFVNALHEATSKLQSVQQRTQLQKRCLTNLTTALWLIHGANSNVEVTCSVCVVKGEVNTYLFDVLVDGLALDLSATWHAVCSISEEINAEPMIFSRSMPVETMSHGIRMQLKHRVSLKARHDTLSPPLLLECGLHLEQEIPLSGELDRMYVPLKIFCLDAIWFLQPSLVQWHPKELTVEDHLWALAEKRGHPRPESKSVDELRECHQFLVTVLCGSVARALKVPVDSDLLLEKFLLMLFNPIQDISSPMVCFGHKVEINCQRDGEVLKIRLKSSSLSCAVQIRSAVSKRIKVLLQSSGVNAVESVEVSKQLLTFINQLFSQLRQFNDDDDVVSARNKLLKVYDQLRNGFTCNLPFV